MWPRTDSLWLVISLVIPMRGAARQFHVVPHMESCQVSGQRAAVHTPYISTCSADIMSSVSRQINSKRLKKKAARLGGKRASAKWVGPRLHFILMRMRGFTGLLPISEHSKSLKCGSLAMPHDAEDRMSLQRLQNTALLCPPRLYIIFFSI